MYITVRNLLYITVRNWHICITYINHRLKVLFVIPQISWFIKYYKLMNQNTFLLYIPVCKLATSLNQTWWYIINQRIKVLFVMQEKLQTYSFFSSKLLFEVEVEPEVSIFSSNSLSTLDMNWT